MVRDISSSYKIDYVIVIKTFLNPEGRQNPIKSYSHFTKGWIWLPGGVASGRVCACSLRSRLDLSISNNKIITLHVQEDISCKQFSHGPRHATLLLVVQS